MNDFLKFIQEPRLSFIYLLARVLRGTLWLDKLYIKILYRYRMGKPLNLEKPETFNEKLQWLKLYDRKQEYINIVDKYEVRKYISETIGEKYLVPLLGVWDKFDDIDFNLLPNQFVLKCTHDSGGNVFCKDKSTFDLKAAKKKMNMYLKRNYFINTREWQYKRIKPRIIAEPYLVDESGTELKDYKFLCFSGKPRILLVLSNRGEDTRSDFFDLNFKHIPMRHHYKNSSKELYKPKGFDEMIQLAEKLSKGFNHIRTDFYDINGKVFVGELTFYQFGGFQKFEPDKYDRILGSWIELPTINNKNNYKNKNKSGEKKDE